MLTAHDFLYTELARPPHWATVLQCGGTRWDDGASGNFFPKPSELHFLCAGSVERELMEFRGGPCYSMPLLIFCFELKNDVQAERCVFAFVCHMSDVSTHAVHWAFYFMVTEEMAFFFFDFL